MICKNCGNEYDNAYSACPYCGAEAEVEVEVAEKAPANPSMLTMILSIVSLVLTVIPALNLSALICAVIGKLKAVKPAAADETAEETAEVDEAVQKKIKLSNTLNLAALISSAVFFAGSILQWSVGIVGVVIFFIEEVL